MSADVGTTTPQPHRLRLSAHRDIIAGVAERWKAQYCHAGQWRDVLSNRASAIYERLSALDVRTAAVDDVAAIIGNSSWTRNECASCEREVSVAVAIEAGDGWECGDTLVCRDCLIAATDLLNSATLPSDSTVGAQDPASDADANTSSKDVSSVVRGSL